MSDQPPYGNPPGGGYPPPPPGGGYPPPPGGGYPPPGGGYPPPGGGYPGGGGGYPPPGGNYPPPPEEKTKTLGMAYNVAAMLCYLPVCCANLIFPIIWMATEPKENRFLRFHSLQALMLAGAGLIVCVLLFICGLIIGALPYSVAVAASLLLLIGEILLCILFLVLYIMGMVKAYQRQMWKMPIIGNIAEKNA
ncbi:MAG: hypothetical protein V7641_2737 [Blastocatellia bacterium]